tara:strand:- start:2912 stop:3607 length:696 start_codon:yes stop_codon:yes gene_type:complete
MRILGINWDHPASVSLLKDNEITACVSEERFTKLKNDISFPAKSINYCVNAAGSDKHIDGLGLATLQVNYLTMLVHYSTNFSIADKIREQHEVWYPRLYEGKDVDYAEVFRDKCVFNQYPQDYWSEYDPSKIDTYAEDMCNIFAQFLNIERNKVVRVEHHQCHAYYGYYCSPFRDKEALVITIDGVGDGLNATVSIADGNDTLKRIYETDKCVIGRIYRHITLLLGPFYLA